MKNISIVGIEARNKVIEGADYLASAVASTLGSYGSNCLIENGNKITNDGFTVSTAIAPTIKDEFARRGALTLHEAAAKTNDQVGDATTTSIILAQAILKEAIRLLPNDKTLVAKKKPSEILKMIEESKKNVIEKLKQSVKLITSEQELIESAKVSVEDDTLARLIGGTQYVIGKDGYIIAEEVNETTSSIDIVKGIRIDNGFGTPFVITDQVNQSLEVRDSNILLTNYTILESDIIALKEKVINPLIAQKKNQLIIIARAFDSGAIKLCMNSLQAGFAIYPINAPYVYQSDIMRDLAVITGAQYFDTEDSRLEDLDIRHLGFVSKLVARRFDAIITGPTDSENILVVDAVNTRIKQLEDKLVNASDFDKKLIQQRIAKFKSGFAILKVGAETILERKYKKDKADDAVNSVRLALQEGTVKGAGLAFKEISDTLADDDILKRPLLSIYNQIITSAPDGFVIEDWVRDPYLTLVAALTNACSVAGQIATINSVVTAEDVKTKKEDEE